MLRADFHVHTSYSPDSAMSPQRLVERCLAAGLTCIAVTDHNTLRGAHETARLAPFRIIIGEEIETSDGDLIGLFLQTEVPKGLPPMEAVRRIKAQGGLVAIPHPFDVVRRSVLQPSALAEVLPHADMIESFNSRNLFSRANRRALAVATARGLLVTAVSDAHHPRELGGTYTEIPEFDGTAEGFKQALTQARLVGRPSGPWVHLLSTWNKLLHASQRLSRPGKARGTGVR